ncbi:heterodisulfide reductase-related iron-sulfur binding cluster, partial [Rhizobium ruizarguesonis]
VIRPEGKTWAYEFGGVTLQAQAGVEVVLPEGEVCCGSLVNHMGRAEQALESARASVDIWKREIDGQGLDAIIITASGCGTTIKDY